MSKCCATPPMSALGKLRRSNRPIGEGPVWAGLPRECGGSGEHAAIDLWAPLCLLY